jgi:hypothetical protein
VFDGFGQLVLAIAAIGPSVTLTLDPRSAGPQAAGPGASAVPAPRSPGCADRGLITAR